MHTPTLATWSLRGPVHTLSSHICEWDPSRQEWGPPRHRTTLTFDEHGRQIEMDQPGSDNTVNRSTYRYDTNGRLMEVLDGRVDRAPSVTRYTYDDRDRLLRVDRISDEGVEETIETSTYDERGRRAAIEHVPAGVDGYGVAGSEHAYGAPGARTQTTHFDEHGRSTLSEFHDQAGNVVRRIRFERDAAGRAVLEEATIDEPLPSNMSPNLAPEDAEKLLALVRDTFAAVTTRYTYDVDGRLIERLTTMGRLSEERHTFQYDEFGNPISEVAEQSTCEVGLDDAGTPAARNERAHRTETVFEYVYDPHGNWTSRVVSSSHTPNEPMTRRVVERRAIEYF